MSKLRDKNIFRLFIGIITILLLFTGISIIIIYNVNFSEKRTLLKALCQNQTDVIKSVYNENNDAGAVINFLNKQHEITKGMGTTGEFTIGYKKNDSIYFIFRMKQRTLSNYTPIPFESDFAAPLKYALSKNTGFIKGLDYNGNKVLAYCNYIPELKWGIVAKMDITEVMMPFYNGLIIALISSIILLLATTIVYRRLSLKVNKRIEESEENYHRLFEYSAIPIWKEDYSEIKKYFDNLKASGVKDFRDYFDTHEDEVGYLASQIKVVDVNQKSVEFFGADNKDNVIKNVLFYYNEDSLKVFKEELIILANGGKAFEGEMQRRTLTGDIKTILLHLAVVKGFEDTLSNVLVSFIDISERKHNEEIIREKNEQLSVVFNGVSETLMLLDIEGNILAANETTEKRFNLGKPGIVGKNIFDSIPVRFHSHRKEQIAELIREKKPINFQDNLNNTYLDVTFYPIFDADGNVKQFISSALDITERKKAEEALKQSEERFKAMAEASPVGMGVTGIANGEFLYVNPAYEQHFGYNKDELLSKVAPDIYYDKKDRDLIKQKLKENNYVENYEVRLKKKDGTIFWSLSSIRPITYMNKPALLGAFTDISYRKQAEEARKESEEKLWSILNATQESVYMFDKEGKFTMSNTTGLKRLNLTSEESLIGRNFSEFMTPELAKHRQAMVDEVFRTGKSVEFEDERNKMFFHHNFFPVFKNKAVTNVVSYSTDITEIRKRERELNKLNRMLNAHNKSSLEMLRATDELHYLNKVCEIIIKQCGYLMVWIGYAENDKEKTVKPVAFSGFEEGYLETLKITWADNERGRGPTGTSIRTGKLAVCRDMLTDPALKPWCDDAVKRGYASSLAFPLMNENKAFGAITIYSKEKDSFSDEEIDLLNELAGDLAYGITSIRNRNAQLEAEEALKESEAKLRAIFETSVDAIGVSKEGIHVFANPAYLNLFGYSSDDDLMGKPITNLIANSERDRIVDNTRKRVLGELKLSNYESRGLRKDGSEFDMDVRVSSYMSYGEKFNMVIIRDITERKKFEDALADKNFKLEESNATKDKFFKIIAHDMKNPFISLLGASELLYENAAKYDSEKIATLTKVLNDSAKSGYDMLLNLLEWSRSQAGSMMFQPEQIKLLELINKNHTNLIENAAGKKISLKFDIAEDTHVYADKNMLDTVLRNLINNALKFTHKGGKVTVSTKNDDDSVIISVKDSGIGIKAEDFDKLFRSDIKYSQPGTEHEGGTGLGLLLCKEFVEKHGGKLWVESEVNKGTTFYFSLKNNLKLAEGFLNK